MFRFIFFTAIRYIEFGIFSLIVLWMAKTVGPAEFGSFAYAFIFITYSAFIVLGVNQLLVKEYSKSTNDSFRSCLVIYSCLINFIGIILIFTVSFMSFSDLSLNLAVIAGSKIIVECSATIYRVRNKLRTVNFLYLSNAIPIGIMFLVFEIDSMTKFFKIWTFSVSIAALVGLVLICRQILQIEYSMNKFRQFLKSNANRFVKTGIQLMIIGLITPFIASFDKLILSYIYFPTDLLGAMQLADNLSSALVLGVGAFVFIITPTYIRKIHSGELAVSQFLKYGYIIALGITATILCLVIISQPILKLIFPDYDLIYPLCMQLITRFTLSSLFMINIIVMVSSFEKQYLYIVFAVLTIYAFLLMSIFFFTTELSWFYLTPIAGLLASILLHILSFSRMKKKKEDL